MQKKHIVLILLCSLVISSCTNEYGLLTDIGIGVIIWIVAGLVIVVCKMGKRYKTIKEKKQAIKEALSERKDFTESKVIKGEGENMFYLATDDTRKKVFYVFGSKTLLFDFKDVEAVQIKENGCVFVSKVSTDSALLGALIGDAVIGGKYGGLLGASAFGEVISQKQINSMSVYVLLRNQPLSSIDFKCFDNGGKPLPQANYRLAYELATRKAKELYNVFQGIIDEVDTERIEEEKRIEALRKEEVRQVRNNMQRIVAAQEMIDVAGLYLSGKISDEEFAKLKEKIIDKE